MIKDVLDIKPGITAVIGSGGKTSLIRKLAEEICAGAGCFGNHDPAVIICTTTHILRPDDIPVFEMKTRETGENEDRKLPGYAEQVEMQNRYNAAENLSADIENITGLSAFLAKNTGRPVCIGITDPENPQKLVSFPIDMIQRAAGSNAYILVEADGAKHMPMKAHNDREPVIPEGCNRVLLVIGAEGFGKPIIETVHRPEIFARLAGAEINDIITPELLSQVLKAELPKFGNSRLQVLVNRTAGGERLHDNHTAGEELHNDDYTADEERTYANQPADGIQINYNRKADEQQLYADRIDVENARKLAELTGLEVYVGCVKNGTVTACGS